MKEIVDYKQLNEDVFILLNKARKDPLWVADELTKLKKFYKDKEYWNPSFGFHLLTDEGYKAVEEAINYLRNEVYPQKEL